MVKDKNSEKKVELRPNATKKKKSVASAFPLLCVLWPTGGAIASSGRFGLKWSFPAHWPWFNTYIMRTRLSIERTLQLKKNNTWNNTRRCCVWCNRIFLGQPPTRSECQRPAPHSQTFQQDSRVWATQKASSSWYSGLCGWTWHGPPSPVRSLSPLSLCLSLSYISSSILWEKRKASGWLDAGKLLSSALT